MLREVKQLHTLTAFFVLALGFAASAQTSLGVDSSTPGTSVGSAPAAEPSSTTKADNTRYLSNPDLLTECASRVSAFSDKPCDIIFIGDTLTAQWAGAGKAIWDKAYAPRNALDFGVSGDKTQNVLWRLNNMDVQSLKPKVAVIMVGTENTDNSAHEIADGIKEVLTNTEGTFPGVKIILVSLPPNDRDNDKTMQVNSLIKGHADDESVYFLNLASLMPSETTALPNGTSQTSWKGLAQDQLHLDASGYQIWADAMEPLLAKLLTAAGQ